MRVRRSRERDVRGHHKPGETTQGLPTVAADVRRGLVPRDWLPEAAKEGWPAGCGARHSPARGPKRLPGACERPRVRPRLPQGRGGIRDRGGAGRRG